MDQKESISKAPSGRPTRTPIGSRNLLTVRGKDPGYSYRIVNDTEDRIQRFLDAGYEVVTAEGTKVGDNRASQASVLGSKQVFSVGGGTKGVLMRIKKEWFDEDQANKQKKVDDMEASIKKKALDGTYGSLTINRD